MSKDEEITMDSISDGVSYLAQGYFDYASEVLENRALPNLYDGLKPVHRHIIYDLQSEFKGKNNFIKSARIVGDVMGKYHPHGDGAIYGALVLMTQKNGSLAFPLIEGSGEFGAVYKTDPPAAMRYTEAKLHSWARNEYFGAMHGIKMIPNFDASDVEPECLPVSFPAVLVNSTSGIAVGFRSKAPSFNFNEVCDLVIEYIKDGKCHTVIEPDFVTGGYYIRNKEELLKLMKTGRGKLKLKGKFIQEKDKLHAVEIPFGQTVQGIIKQINDINEPSNSIKSAYDSEDFDHDTKFTVKCKKNSIETAMLMIHKFSDFQYTYSADITVVQNGAPKRMGVWSIIEEWVKWRRGVLIKEYKYRIDALKESLKEAIAFMNIINAEDKKKQLVEIITTQGRDAGRDFIRENFTREEVPEELISFVSGRSLPDYHTGGKYREIYNNANEEIASLTKDIDNIDDVIIRDMNRLKATYGSELSRRTEVTDSDYNFENVKSSKELESTYIDDSDCCFTVSKNFVKKERFHTPTDSDEFVIDGKANDTLLAFDNRGRILRIYCEDLPYNGQFDTGVYIPKYCNLNETDDYEIIYVCRLTGENLMLLYKDGNVGFVDTSEWLQNNRRVKVLEKGISAACADKLGVVFHEGTIPEILFVTDNTGRIGWVYTSDLKRKDRTAKTRAFTMYKDAVIDSYCCVTSLELGLMLNNVENYHGTMRFLNDISDWSGSESDFTEI